MYFEFEDCSTADNSLENGQQLRHQQLSSSTPARSGFIQSNLAIKSTPSPPLDLAGSSVPPTPSISPITGLSKANGVFAEPNLEQGYLSPSRPLQRRYSIHSDSNVGNHQPLYFRQLGGGSNSHLEDIESPGGMEEENVSLCDLALITKSKLSQMNGGSYIKALEDKKVDADIPVTPSFSKHSNSDLRREVLLASIHRSLSASSDDLKNLCRSPRAQPESISFDSYLAPQVGAHYDDMMTNVGGDGGGVPAAPRPSCSSLATSSVSTNITAGSSRATSISASSSDEQMSDNSFLHNLFDTSNSGSSLRQRVRRSLNMSYLPTETLSCMNSQTTMTSTTSMAGNKNHLLHQQQQLGGSQLGPNHHGSQHLHHHKSHHHNRGYLKRLNALNLMGVGGNGVYYSGNTIAPKLTTLTMSSNQLLRKRIHSSSPSKASYPYHTMATCVPSGGLLFSAGGSGGGGQSSTGWDNAFKRLKVVHSSVGTSNTSTTPSSGEMLFSSRMPTALPAASTSSADSQASGSGDNNILPTRSYPSSAEQLNELAENLDRLKTPFT